MGDINSSSINFFSTTSLDLCKVQDEAHGVRLNLHHLHDLDFAAVPAKAAGNPWQTSKQLGRATVKLSEDLPRLPL